MRAHLYISLHASMHAGLTAPGICEAEIYLNPVARFGESDMVEKKKIATFRSSSDSQS